MKLTKYVFNNCIVTKLVYVRPHSNADKLQLATVLGNTVIVGLESKEGDVVLYFNSNLKLSSKYLYENNLYRKAEFNQNKDKTGYFGDNGRVKATKLRGEISNGYVAPLESLSLTTTTNIQKLYKMIGTEFTHIDGEEVCVKYEVPRRNNSQGGGKNNKKIDISVQSKMFTRHLDEEES